MSKRWWRPAGLVFLTVHEDADFARAALDASGLGYVVKARLASDLLRETSRLARGSQLLSHSVRIAPLHLIKARLVNQALTLGEGRNQPAALLQHALIAQCAQHRLHALHRALKSSVGV